MQTSRSGFLRGGHGWSSRSGFLRSGSWYGRFLWGVGGCAWHALTGRYFAQVRVARADNKALVGQIRAQDDLAGERDALLREVAGLKGELAVSKAAASGQTGKHFLLYSVYWKGIYMYAFCGVPITGEASLQMLNSVSVLDQPTFPCLTRLR